MPAEYPAKLLNNAIDKFEVPLNLIAMEMVYI